MCMAIACDHLGWKLKAQRIQRLERQGHAVEDLGCDKNEVSRCSRAAGARYQVRRTRARRLALWHGDRDLVGVIVSRSTLYQ